MELVKLLRQLTELSYNSWNYEYIPLDGAGKDISVDSGACVLSMVNMFDKVIAIDTAAISTPDPVDLFLHLALPLIELYIVVVVETVF
jgi:hypothetical protein